MKKKASEENPIPVKLVSVKDFTPEQIANGEVGSAYSNSEVALRNKLARESKNRTDDSGESLGIDEEKYISEAEAIEADVLAMGGESKLSLEIFRQELRDMGLSEEDIKAVT